MRPLQSQAEEASGRQWQEEARGGGAKPSLKNFETSEIIMEKMVGVKNQEKEV